MTEAEWLASDDPAAMLAWHRRTVGCGGGPGGSRHLTDSKLRLWVEACRFVCEKTSTLSFHWHSLDAEQGLDRTLPWWTGSDQTGEPIYLEHLSAADRCHLLRDIVGNPFRPVTLPPCDRCSGDGLAHGSDRPFAWTGPGTYPGPCPKCEGRKSPLVTPAVASLAQAAYDGREPVTGHLDPLTLAAVADALEEAGCVGDVCPACGPPRKRSPKWVDLVQVPGYWCGRCDEQTHRLPHPILAHLRSPGPHVRGCWVADLILGKE